MLSPGMVFEHSILTQLVHGVQGINHSDTLARGKSQRLYSVWAVNSIIKWKLWPTGMI